jgi:hypothetical protein
MTATPVTPPKIGGPVGIIKRLLASALDQYRKNPVVVVTAVARVATWAATRLPLKFRGPALSLIAYVSAQLIKGSVTPAPPTASPIQDAVDRAKKRLKGAK